MKITTLVLVLCTIPGSDADAQNTFWVQTSGPTGYDVRSFAVDSHGTLFAGTWTDGSVWKTTDNGASWTICGPIPNPNPVLGLVAGHNDFVYASVYGRGVARSTDGGVSWDLSSNGLTNTFVRGSVVDESGNIWVASEGGLFRSTDLGESWVLKKAGYFATVYLDSALSVIADDGTFIYRSSNGGQTWSTAQMNPPVGVLGVHPDGSYFGTGPQSQIYRSTDFGATWSDLHSGVVWDGSVIFATFTAAGDIFYVRNTQGVLISRDNGQTWQITNDGLRTNLTIAVIYHPNGFVFIGTAGSGVFRSRFPVDSTFAPVIHLAPGSLDFGTVIVGSGDTLSFEISNTGIPDTLQIQSITSTYSRFVVLDSVAAIPSGESATIRVAYQPAETSIDTGTIIVSSNDPDRPLTGVSVSGRGFELTHAPFIDKISLIPYDYSQARIVWFRTMDDTAGAADPVVDYSIWRRVNSMTTGPSGGIDPRPASLATVDPAWDFIELVPALGTSLYAAVVPVPYTYYSPLPWYVFMVAARTKGNHIYLSAPDSVLDPPNPTSITQPPAPTIPKSTELFQNYPNPFNPSTVIRYWLSRRENVVLDVCNLLGQEVAKLVDGVQDGGFNEVRFDGTNLPSGVYFYRLTAGTSVKTKKLMLMR